MLRAEDVPAGLLKLVAKQPPLAGSESAVGFHAALQPADADLFTGEPTRFAGVDFMAPDALANPVDLAMLGAVDEGPCGTD